jgi:hypothetical protein
MGTIYAHEHGPKRWGDPGWESRASSREVILEQLAQWHNRSAVGTGPRAVGTDVTVDESVEPGVVSVGFLTEQGWPRAITYTWDHLERWWYMASRLLAVEQAAGTVEDFWGTGDPYTMLDALSDALDKGESEWPQNPWVTGTWPLLLGEEDSSGANR